MNSQPQSTSHRILVIDDNPAIHEDIRKILTPEGAADASLAATKSLLFGETDATPVMEEFEIDSAFQGEEGYGKVLQAAREGRPYSLAFVDVRMPPGWDGVETVTRIWKEQPELQIVICTAYSDYSWEDMVRQLGRSSSMVVLKKPFDNIEVIQLAHALAEKWKLTREITAHISELDKRVAARTAELNESNLLLKRENEERRIVERALVQSEERFSKAFNANPIPLAIQSTEDESFTVTNRGFQELTGYSNAELFDHTPGQLGLWVDIDSETDVVGMLKKGHSVRHLPCQLRTRAGEVRDILLSVEVIQLSERAFLLAIFEDVTEQLLLEKQLRHSQKMEAVGQLAAGIAHDFNNMLTVIQGNTSLILSDDPRPAENPLLESILRAAQRSAKLVRQLLAFSHKQMMEVRAVNVGELLGSLSDMLSRMLGEQIAIEVDVTAGIPPISADPAMLEQLLMNLAVNARDAMPRGGRLRLTADPVEVSAAAARINQDARAGSFLCIAVADDGEGIPPDVLPRIFEPFFTTKPIGKGTGLGLATSYGIAKQHEGWIEVQSEPGLGTTFKIFLPLTPVHVQAAVAARAESDSVPHGTESILVVEDEEAVRSCVCTILRAKGFKVLAASNGVEALSVWKAHGATIDLLLTDMVMPEGLSGHDLAEKLLVDRPGLKVIYTSGYSSELVVAQSTRPAGGRFLAKPYQSKLLMQTVREALDSQPAAELPN
ncbi:MAG TPA: response regulator [Opitutaceae bacterium]|nr:response regulator [Opitutaceae bacterium]